MLSEFLPKEVKFSYHVNLIEISLNSADTPYTPVSACYTNSYLKDNRCFSTICFVSIGIAFNKTIVTPSNFDLMSLKQILAELRLSRGKENNITT